MPKGLRTKAKGAPQEIWLEGTKEDTVTALETFVKTDASAGIADLLARVQRTVIDGLANRNVPID